MPPRPMTPSEKLVGRKLPKEASYYDQVLASYVKEDGTTCGRAEPVDSWLRSAFRKARKEGLLRLVNKMSINGSRAFGVYQLTEKGRPIAHEARARLLKAREDRKQWGVDFHAARKEFVAAKKAQEAEAEQVPDTPEP
jgi:DNA-binding PadR family transcriptional regulator